MPGPFDAVGTEVGDWMGYVVGGAALALVTVLSIAPDTGATLATATNVTALKRARRRQPFGVGGGGEVGADQSRFVLKAAEITFDPTTLKARDRIVDNSGVTWEMENVTLSVFGKFVMTDVVKKR